MSKLVFFSAANPIAAANLSHSVRDGVALDLVSESRMLSELEAKAQDGRVRLWGSASGERGRNVGLWRRIEPPAVAFFYTEGAFGVAARIWAKEPAGGSDGGNADLAHAVWGDPSYEHIVYLDEIEEVDVPTEDMKAALGYEPTWGTLCSNLGITLVWPGNFDALT